MSYLYLFTIDTTRYGFTSNLVKEEFGGTSYAPATITCSNINVTENFDKSSLTIDLPQIHWFGRLLLNTLIDDAVKVSIYKDYTLFWEGTVKSTSANSNSTISIACDSMYSTVNRTGEFPKLTLPCRHKLYSPGCGVVQAVWGQVRTIQSINGKFITLTTMPEADEYYDNGILQVADQKRRIVKHLPDRVLHLSYPLLDVTSGNVTIFRGCSLTEEACITFNNLANFGGWERISVTKNPFKSTGLL